MNVNIKINRTTAILLAGLSLLVVAALFIVPGVAAASCFTDTSGHWAESFICWMKTKGLSSGYADGTFRPNNSISRAEVAVFMQKIITTGEAHINIGPGQWVPNGVSEDHSVDYFTSVDRLVSSATGLKYYQLSPAVPTTFLGQSMALRGVQFCYATTSGATITYLALRQYAGGQAPQILAKVEDSTVRTDATCRTYNLSGQSVLYGSDHVVIIVGVNFSDTVSYVDIGATTFILTPITSLGVLDLERPDLDLPLELFPGEAP